MNATETGNRESRSTGTIALFSFVGGALLGALAVALTTPKAGSEVRRDLRAFGRRAKGKVAGLGDEAEAAWSEACDRTSQSAFDLKRGAHEAADDVRRGLHEASLDLKRGMHEAATDLRVGNATPAARSTEVNNGIALT